MRELILIILIHCTIFGQITYLKTLKNPLRIEIIEEFDYVKFNNTNKKIIEILEKFAGSFDLKNLPQEYVVKSNDLEAAINDTLVSDIAKINNKNLVDELLDLRAVIASHWHRELKLEEELSISNKKISELLVLALDKPIKFKRDTLNLEFVVKANSLFETGLPITFRGFKNWPLFGFKDDNSWDSNLGMVSFGLDVNGYTVANDTSAVLRRIESLGGAFGANLLFTLAHMSDDQSRGIILSGKSFVDYQNEINLPDTNSLGDLLIGGIAFSCEIGFGIGSVGFQYNKFYSLYDISGLHDNTKILARKFHKKESTRIFFTVATSFGEISASFISKSLNNENESFVFNYSYPIKL